MVGMRDRGPFAFAGLWEHWTAREGAEPADASAGPQSGEGVETFTILTTAANGIVAPIHHRMPVILAADTFGSWLVGAEVPLGPYPPNAMTT